MLYDKLRKYAESDVYPFHMPGHKRTAVFKDIPFDIDLTEIEGFDDLHNPSGCIKSVEDKAARLFGAKRAFLLINGATAGILSAVRALTKPGDTVIMARNCHRSVYNAVELCALNPVYVIPGQASYCGNALDFCGSLTPQSIEGALRQNPSASLVIVTSPTYEGIASDIAAISAVCHEYGAKLFVDEAHGAHFPFSAEFPKTALESGADVSVVSLHKTLPALTQTALLLTGSIELERALQSNLDVFQTSSPSYALMSSIELCLDFCANGKNEFGRYVSLVKDFREKALSLKNLCVLFSEKEKSSELYDLDLGKLVISSAGTSLSGRELAGVLREKYAIETEMSSGNCVLAMTSVCDRREGFERLLNALFELDNLFYSNGKKMSYRAFLELPKRFFKPSERFEHSGSVTQLNECAGKTSLEYVYAYPPGIPLIVPGEVIGEALICEIEHMIKCGADIYSSEKNMPRGICVTEI